VTGGQAESPLGAIFSISLDDDNITRAFRQVPSTHRPLTTVTGIAKFEFGDPNLTDKIFIYGWDADDQPAGPQQLSGSADYRFGKNRRG